MKQLNKYFTIVFLYALSSQSIYPMAGTNPESRSWINNLKNSVTGLCSKALAYCSLQKVNDATELVRNNPGISAALFAAATGGAWGAWTLYKNNQIKPCNDGRESNAEWESHLKIPFWYWRINPKTKQRESCLAHKKGAQIDADYSPERNNSLSERVARAVSPYKTLEIEYRDKENKPYKVTNPQVKYHLRGTQDGFLRDRHEKQFHTPIKHNGLTISRRYYVINTANNQPQYSLTKLFRYPLIKEVDDKSSKRDMPKKIIVSSKFNSISELVVHQNKNHLEYPVVYVTVKQNTQDRLKRANAEFIEQGGNLYIYINDNDFMQGELTPIDIELHLPNGVMEPTLEYTTPQSPAKKYIH